MSTLTSIIKKLILKKGYIVQKYPTDKFQTLSVFDLSVHHLMTLKTEPINFIQVGANDGKFGDPLRKFILNHSWHGVLIEPQKNIFDNLCQNYSEASERLIFENIAISNTEEQISLYRSAKQSGPNTDCYASSVVSVNEKVIRQQLKLKNSDLQEFKVNCSTLDTLIEKHQITQLDLLQIDAEGHDHIVLETIDLSIHQPSIIQFEHGHLSPAQINKSIKRLNEYGYDVLYGGYQTDTLALLREVFYT